MNAAMAASLLLSTPTLAQSVVPAILLKPQTVLQLIIPPTLCASGLIDGKCGLALPERPSAPHVFGLSATPAYTKGLLSAWDGAWSPPLQEPDETSFKELVEQAEAMAPEDRPAFVNRWVNWHIRFEDDTSDHWASANATLLRRAGDCEDFVILKMALLERVGIPQDRMFLIIVRDRFSPIAHAVAALRREDDAMIILDNRTDLIRVADQVSEYEPTLSFSGPFAWVYGQQRQASGTATAPPSMRHSEDAGAADRP